MLTVTPFWKKKILHLNVWNGQKWNFSVKVGSAELAHSYKALCETTVLRKTDFFQTPESSLGRKMILERESFGILVVWGRTNYGGMVSGTTRKSEAVQSYEDLQRGKERKRWPWIRIGLVLRGVETTMWPDIILPTYPKSCCFTFPICSISCLSSITPLTKIFFLLTCFLSSSP